MRKLKITANAAIAMQMLCIAFIVLLINSRASFAQDADAIDVKNVQQVLRLFKNDDAQSRGNAADLLCRYGRTVVPALVQGLHDSDLQVRRLSAITLCKLGREAQEAVPGFLQLALHDSDEVIQLQCIQALGGFPEYKREITPVLDSVLRGGNKLLSVMATYSLQKVSPEYFSTRPDRQNVIKLIEALIPELQEKFHVPGVSVVLIENEKICYTKNFGVSDIRTNEAVTDSTMFEACSMSKPLFSYMAWQYYNANGLDIDQPIAQWFSDPALNGQDYAGSITPRMLLTHTSGLPNWRPGDELEGGVLPVLFKPGLRFSYSGEGMFLLQRTLEVMTKIEFNHYARITLLKQLGMHNSSYLGLPEFQNRIAAGHTETGAFKQKTAYTRANAGYTLYCSAQDYAKFLIAMMNTEEKDKYSLSNSALLEMLRPQVAATVREPINRPGRAFGTSVHWGFGWGINTTASGNIYYHSGSNGSGFRCYSQFRTNEGSGIVIMTNGEGGSELWGKVIAEIGDW